MTCDNVVSRMAALLRKVTHSWYYGKRIVEAVYNIETVFLHQNEVIGHGKELCHHLPVCVVGAAEAGKTSLIRKLTDQPFVKVHEPTEILDTTTVEPVLVSQQYVEAKTWRAVKEKTDTDDLIAFRVNSTLKEAAAADRGSSIPLYFMRFFLFFLLVESTCFYSLSYGARPLANIGLCAMYGFCLLGRSDTGLRLGLGFTTMAYGVTWPAAEALVRSCDGGSCTQQEYVSIIFPFLLRPVLWGFAVAYGLVPGMASGLAIIQLASTAADKCTILDQIYPGTQNLLLSWEFDSSVAAYWLFTFILAFVEFLIINKNHTMAAVKVMPVCILGVLLVSQYFLGVINISLAFLYPITMMMMHTVGVCFMSIGHKFGPVQNPAGLLKIDLIKNFCEAHVPGTLLGVFAGTCILGGEISHIIQTMDSFFVTAAILVFVFILPKLSVIHLYFTQPNDGERESQNAEQAKLSGKLHQCFKLLVRDFAGQMVYHCLHQPFLPKFGIFVCTFSWTQARKYSLKHAEGVNQPEDGPDVCLNEILFWLKNISMHRLHPINQVDSSPDTANAMDQQNIKNIFLAATHHSYESCGLDENQKAKIMAYYKSKLSGYRDIYTCINFDVSPAGVISLENSNDQSEGGIEVLKKNVLQTAEKVIRHCFPVPVPVYFWCWLKERRDHFEKANIPPCETLLQSRQELDARGRYMTVYPKNTFCKMINTFCNIGEIFLVQNKDSGHGKAGDDLDYFIFFDIQFLIDFMKDIVKIDNKKTTDRLMAEDWESLRRRGTAPTALLRHHLQRFYETKGMTQVYADHPLERQPLVRSMLQLDFMFFVGDHFFLPQLLPKYNIQENHPDYFSEVDQIQWELVFDFKDFEFHHEYVFFRVLAKCANLYSYEKRAVFKDWASFGEEQKQIPIQGDRVRQSEEQHWFTLSCEKRGSDDGEYNRIYLRTHLDFNREKSLGVMKNVTNAVTTITTESFAKLGGKLSTFFNCPNRTNLKNAHKIADYHGAHRSSTHRLDKVVMFDCGDECNHNQETHVVRLDPDGIPYKAVSQGVKDWLCTNLDERQFKALLSYLLNMNIAHLEKQFKVRARGRDLSSRNVCEEVKTGLLDQWTEGYDASLNSLCGALDTLELSDTRSVLVTRFPQ